MSEKQQEIIGSGLDREQVGHGVDPALEEVAIAIYIAESKANTRERWLNRDTYLDRNRYRLAARDSIVAKGNTDDPLYPENVEKMTVTVKDGDGTTKVPVEEPVYLEEHDADGEGGTTPVVTLTGGGKNVELAPSVEPGQPEPVYVAGEAFGAEGNPKKDGDASNDNKPPAGEAMIKPVDTSKADADKKADKAKADAKAQAKVDADAKKAEAKAAEEKAEADKKFGWSN